MGKNYDNDEMEIDLLELFYVLKSKILAILVRNCDHILQQLILLYYKKMVRLLIRNME